MGVTLMIALDNRTLMVGIVDFSAFFEQPKIQKTKQITKTIFFISLIFKIIV
jgi:hypothetical protein